MKSVFSVRALSRVMRAGDSHRFDIDVAAEGQAIAEQLADDIGNRAVDLSTFVRGRARGKPCVTYPSYERSIILRVLAGYIAKRFRITPPNRDRVVSGVIETMFDATPYTVIRRDVTSFYESIDADALRERLVYDTSLPRIVRTFLQQYFDAHCLPGVLGLPRGVGLSGVLAELAMEQFDRRVRAMPGVYRYFRYSDDIVVFCYDRAAGIANDMVGALPTGMLFHAKKRSETAFVDRTSNSRHLDYLGYRFSTTSGTGSRESRTIVVTIAPEKIKRLKTRVIMSLKRFMKDGNTNLLFDRLRLLSSNHQLQRHGVSFWGPRKRVRTGIFYNYRRCGIYNHRSYNCVEPPELGALDTFTHHLLRSRHSEFSARLRAAMGLRHLILLDGISFRLGFKSRRLVRLSNERLAQAREAWRNV
ncbi:antiviral reverse transcriptase Drt3a [Brevundimonas naejangsanensis]|uniref:antiviral reverse transcriptase Drt3a n=1 Tax=Brevundimonas naejangsanensis TaxID=588932 RepID=UPI00138AB7EC|nr:antiviral reverse transcriptase Drt3a [Brevundimonas naejangsanensis]